MCVRERERWKGKTKKVMVEGPGASNKGFFKHVIQTWVKGCESGGDNVSR